MRDEPLLIRLVLFISFERITDMESVQLNINYSDIMKSKWSYSFFFPPAFDKLFSVEL